MKKEMDLCQVIYSVLVTQIRFGTYRFGDRLPTLEEASQLMLVSIDTVRMAYRRLQTEGFITLSKSIGTTVKVQYSEAEIDKNIQKFYAEHKAALQDLSQSMRLLFGNALWLALKNAPEKALDEMEGYAAQKAVFPVYAQQMQEIYGFLHNDLLMRLVWQTFMFFQAPFLSIAANLQYFTEHGNPLLDMTAYSRKKDWAGLRRTIDAFQDLFPIALSQFYEERITQPPSDKQIFFAWSSYKKPSQLCYSLTRKLLGSISRGEYPAGSYLPSLEKLAKEKRVSVSTIRRTLTVLNQIGAVKSVNGVGTKVLPLDQSSENCDFSQPVIRKRLLDYLQSLQIFTLTCRSTAESTLASLSSGAVAQWKKQLCGIRDIGRYETVIYDSLYFISLHSPLQTIRLVYDQLLHLLFWGHPLRGLMGDPKIFNRFFLPHLDSLIGCLECGDAAAFATRLEKVSLLQLNYTAELMTGLGFPEAEFLRIPETL